MSLFMAGMQSTAMKTAADFGWTRAIDDVLSAPIPRWIIPVEKMVFGAIHGIVAASVVIGLAVWLLNDWPKFSEWDFGVVLVVVAVSSVCAGACGVALGAALRPQTIGPMIGLIMSPIVFLGGPFYPRSSLEIYPVLQAISTANPLLYICEAFRRVLSGDINALPLPMSLLGMCTIAVVFGALGVRSFLSRVTE
jgi:ABC-2 type transport system permease protein